MEEHDKDRAMTRPSNHQTDQLRHLAAYYGNASSPSSVLAEHLLRLSERLDAVIMDLCAVNDCDNPLNEAIAIHSDCESIFVGLENVLVEVEDEQDGEADAI